MTGDRTGQDSEGVGHEALPERKDRMLRELQHVMRMRVRRRRAVRTAAAVVVPCLAAAGAAVALHGNGPANDQGVQAAPRLTGVTPAPFRVENQANEGATASIVVVVHTDAAAAARHIATNPAKANVETLSDDELLELLAATGRPAGIVRVRGEAHVAEIAPVAGVVTPDPGAPAPPGARRGGPGQVQRLS